MTNKHYTIDGYVLDTLMRDLVGHDHRPSAFLVYLSLAALGDVALSHAQLAECAAAITKDMEENGLAGTVSIGWGANGGYGPEGKDFRRIPV